jgi:hypothetical protein
MVQIGCRCLLGKQDAFLERVRGFEAREAPADWRQQLGLRGPIYSRQGTPRPERRGKKRSRD